MSMSLRVRKDYKYKTTIVLDLEDARTAEWIYKSIMPDIRRERIKDLEVRITHFDNRIQIVIKSNSVAKFIGLCGTIIRLLRLLNNLI